MNDMTHEALAILEAFDLPGLTVPDDWLQTFETLKRERRFEEAQQWVHERFGSSPADVDSGLLQADFYSQARAVDESYAVYNRLLARDLSLEKKAQVRLAYARRLFGHGLGRRAWKVIAHPSMNDATDPQVKSHARKIGQSCELLERLEQRRLEDHENTRILAFRHALLHFSQRTVRPLPADRIGRLTLLTGSLGGGGAERQISRLAIGMTRQYRETGRIGELPVDAPVDLVLRSLDPQAQNDFFLPEVEAAGCRVHEINAMPVRSDLKTLTDDPDLRTLLHHQPSHVTFGLLRLVDFFNETRPECVAIWQDGACLYTALAALLAGVPKIQIGFRGLPPVMRQHLHRPEYESMYQALRHVPGVDFLANSSTVAHAYSRWVGIPQERIHIVYNGVTQPDRDEASRDEDRQRWDDFVRATPDATRTIGGVFRFATDKRPNVWIRFAQQCLARHPDSRFVIVGAGDLMPQAQAFADKLGVADRILFVGASRNVGFWMEQMDVMVLLSQFEGLPNVLIEAQLQSLPVVSTPAGGACECFVDGVSGICLDAIDPLDFKQAVEASVTLADRPREALFTPEVQAFLAERFALPQMLDRFVRALRAHVPDTLVSRHAPHAAAIPAPTCPEMP